MKKVKKGAEPSGLEKFREASNTGTWENFKRKKPRTQQLYDKVRLDQGGLCAYCETDLLEAGSSGVDDFRIEHFHPKSDDSSGHNWHLDWSNLLGCCHGGSQRNVVDAGNRFTSPDHSCDVPKGDNNWDELILNPLNLPADPVLFNFSRSTGEISVNRDNCRQAGVDEAKAQNTIDNLRLNSNRLRRLRNAELTRVNELFRRLVSQGKTDSEARDILARAIMRKNLKNCWPRFFSALRCYLGESAEVQLVNINYSG